MSNSNTDLEDIVQEIASQERKPVSGDDYERLEELLNY